MNEEPADVDDVPIAVPEKAAAFCPPPGLEDFAPPPGLSLEDARSEKSERPTEPLPDHVEMPEGSEAGRLFQVLLRNLPEPMCTEPMVRVMLDQASLEDSLVDVEFRKGCKILVSFSEYACVAKCIKHFSGRRWNGSEAVSAMYVRKMAKDDEKSAEVKNASGFNADAKEFVPTKDLSGDAPVFKPLFKPASMVGGKECAFELSASAQVFYPGCAFKLAERPRGLSDASTAYQSEADESCSDEEAGTQIAA
jgi:hypothetical protein